MNVSHPKFLLTIFPLYLTVGGHSWPTAFINVNTVLISPWSAGVCLYQGFFFTFSAEEVSDDENIDDDGDVVDICDIFDDPAVEDQLRQNDVEHEHELQEQGETFTITADVHITPITEHADVGSSSP